MPQSRHRHKRHHHNAGSGHQQTPKRTVKRSAVTIMVVFVSLLGIFVALIAAGTDWLWLATGALIGGVTGYFIGRNMDKLAARNN